MRSRRPAARLLAAAAALLAAPALVVGAASPRPQMQTVIVTMDAAAFPPTVTAASRDGIAADLRARASRHQEGIRSALEAARRRGEVARWEALWIVDGVEVTATPGMIAQLARRADVASVTPNRDAAIAPTALAEPGIALTGAPDVWALGHTGAGVVVANLDTGVAVDHPALAASWRGGTNSWFDPYGQHPNAPFDALGHGTETMGVMVGAGGIGMAPGATWIAGRVFDDQGNATVAEIHKAFQWVLDPDGNPATADAPSVVLNSWTGTLPGCDTTFQPDLQALVAAGILPVFAAGNTGPTAGSNTAPANLPEAFSVGATDTADVIAPFSSRGPANCRRSEFPTMTAPGVGVRTSDLLLGYTTQDGTSFAAPHVAGAAALVLSAAPGTDLAGLENALVTTAHDLGAPGRDDTYGAGRLDALAAVTAAAAAPPPPDTIPPNTFPVVATPAVVSAPPVIVTATVTDARSPVVAAEAFLDVVGPDGTGPALTPVDGAFDTTTETVTGAVPEPIIVTAAAGAHQVFVHGRDAAGNWGPVTAAGVVIDRSGPTVAGNAAPLVVTGGDPVILHAEAVDAPNGASPPSVVTQVAATLDGVTLPALVVTSADHVLDAPAEQLVARLETGGIAPGSHVVGVRARDAVGNWGATWSVAVVVKPPGRLFIDGFESGRTRAWARRVGAAAVRRRARLSGRLGLEVAVGRSPAWLGDSHPDAESGYRVSFSIAAPGATIARRDVLVGRAATGAALVRVQLRARSGRAAARVVCGGRASAWRALVRARARMTVTWRSGPGGSCTLVVGGRAAGALPVADASRLEEVRIGLVDRGSPRDRGRVALDGFVATRVATGAPVANAG